MQHAKTKKYPWIILYEIVTCLCMESLKLTVDYLAAFLYSTVNDSQCLYLFLLKVTHCFAFAAFSHLITRSREHLFTCACRNMISKWNLRKMCLQLCHKEEGGDGGQSSKRNNAPCDLHNPIAHCLRNTLVTPDYIIMNRYLLEVDKCPYYSILTQQWSSSMSSLYSLPCSHHSCPWAC